MRRTAQVTDALRGRQKTADYVGTGAALLEAGLAGAADFTASAFVPAPAQAITAQATAVQAAAVQATAEQATPAQPESLGAVAQRAIRDAAADANERSGAPDPKIAVPMPAAGYADTCRRAGRPRTGTSRARPTRAGGANVEGQRVRPRPELRRPRP